MLRFFIIGRLIAGYVLAHRGTVAWNDNFWGFEWSRIDYMHTPKPMAEAQMEEFRRGFEYQVRDMRRRGY